MNTAAASVMRDSPADPPIWNRIRKTNAFLRKLSLNAEKNWHQNSGAKRRDNRIGSDIEKFLKFALRLVRSRGREAPGRQFKGPAEPCQPVSRRGLSWSSQAL